MNTKSLVEHFVLHAPGFYDDLNLSDIDTKHTKIVKEAYLQMESDKSFTLENFRNWKEQSDLSTPSQVSIAAIRSNGLFKALTKFLYRKLFRFNVDKFLLSAILDDIAIIKLIDGEKLLLENPVHLTPGSSEVYHINGTSVNIRWLRYIYILKRILDKKLLMDNDIWVDVGSFYGGLQGLVKKYRPKSRMVLVDFHHQLCRSYIYLSHLYPGSKHILPDEISKYKNMDDLPEGAIMYVPVSDYKNIADQKADLATNFFSLGEMRREFFCDYMTSSLFEKSKKSLLINRFVSAPFFEKTYDTDINFIDYIKNDRETEYFDIFPMHHFMLLNRKLFGRKCFRNISSPYFEIITSKS